MPIFAGSKARYTDRDLEGVPPPRDWRLSLTQSLPVLQRPLNVSCPCIGLGNAGRALRMLGVKYRLVNSCDLLPQLREPLMQLEGSLDGITLGAIEGDIHSFDIANLDIPVDMLLAGPPCPPFAANGARRPEGQAFRKRMCKVIAAIYNQLPLIPTPLEQAFLYYLFETATLALKCDSGHSRRRQGQRLLHVSAVGDFPREARGLEIRVRRGEPRGFATSASPLEWKLERERRWLLLPQQAQHEASGRDPHWFLLPAGDIEAVAIADREAGDGRWLYDLKFLDEVTGQWWKATQILVREVSSSILLNCSVVIKDNQRFEASITTLSGHEFLRIEQALPPVLYMNFFLQSAEREAEFKGLVSHGDDHNTVLKVFVNGSSESLCRHTVLWDKLWETGWLQDH
eukprot:Skav220056  [mRNA]  locus=scaffold2945:35183:37292:- [translate_table: standard]